MTLASQIDPLRFRVPNGAGTARTRADVREGLLLCIRDERGFEGLGEATPLPGYAPAGDTVAECERALTQYAPLLPASLEATGVPPSARFALETAWLDLRARRAGAPLCDLLAGRPAAASLALNALLPVHTASARAWVERARSDVSLGFRALKAKLGRDGALDEELAALEAVRAAVGPSIELRADANRAWDPRTARRAVARLAASPLRVSFVEEPARALPASPYALPYAADESLRDSTNLAALDRCDGCAVYVLKPGVLGGLRACVALAHRAWARGRAVLVTHAFEGPVGLAAATHLALALAALGPVRASGLDARYLCDAFGERLDPWIFSSRGPAIAARPALPGLGVPRAWLA